MSRAFRTAVFPTVLVTGLYVLVVGASPALMVAPIVAVFAYVVIALLAYVLS